MFYKVHFTMPTLKIKTIEDYKIRTGVGVFTGAVLERS